MINHFYKLLFSSFLVFYTFQTFSQTSGKAITVNAHATKLKDSIRLDCNINIPGGMRLFSFIKQSEDDTFVSDLVMDSATISAEPGNMPVLQSANLQGIQDSSLGNLWFFTDSAIISLTLPASAIKGEALSGTINWLGMQGDEFPSGSIPFQATVAATTLNEQTDSGLNGTFDDRSLWGIFLQAFIIGLGALLTPCVYAMLPVTVSFFLKRSKTRKESIRNAIYYSASIIGIFTLIGFLITVFFGQGALNAFSSSAGFNIFVFLMFMIFGISFLGAFEITLPSSWSTKMDSRAGLGSFAGIFFMAATLVIVSFSCTLPFIGALTVLISKGETITPLIGFFGFSLALALPFTLMALFPGLLNKLARSGGWLNTLKVTFGFIEIALAFKFLSSADLAYHWGILNRDVYLSIWIAIFGSLSLYLLGKIRFHHDDELSKNDYGVPYLGIPRFFAALISLTFTMYLIPGLWGAPLNPLSAWLPEMKTQEFKLSASKASSHTSQPGGTNAIVPVKYTDILESEIPGVTAFFDYEEGLAAAKQLNKPIMIDFTGHACANCRKMEREVLSNEAVMQRLQNDFIVVSLYVDDKTKLPQNEWVKSELDHTNIDQMGEKNLDFEIRLTQSNAQPLYVFVSPEGKLLHNAGGYNPDVDRFISILDKVKKQ